MKRQNDLIYDVGMHQGFDTEFYLKKGFRVVGVEADPGHARFVAEKFPDEIKSGQLKVLNFAIADKTGEIEFYYYPEKSDWGTTDLEFVQRNNDIYGIQHETKTVPCRRFEEIVAEYGVPYYLKVDIEGADMLCLRAIEVMESKPRFVSIELEQVSYAIAASQIELLQNLGYGGFKLVDQAQLKKQKLPQPALEGKYVEWQFTLYSSGMFGEELPGRWEDLKAIKAEYKKILWWQSLFGREGGWSGKWCDTVLEQWFLALRKKPMGWYDLHAKLLS